MDNGEILWDTVKDVNLLIGRKFNMNDKEFQLERISRKPYSPLE